MMKRFGFLLGVVLGILLVYVIMNMAGCAPALPVTPDAEVYDGDSETITTSFYAPCDLTIKRMPIQTNEGVSYLFVAVCR